MLDPYTPSTLAGASEISPIAGIDPATEAGSRSAPPDGSANASNEIGKQKPATVAPPAENAKRLEWALWLVDRGFFVFPLRAPVPGDDKIGKRPLLPGGPWLATRDRDTVTRWFTDGMGPFLNIGVAYWLSGHCLIDLDLKGDTNGELNWLALCVEHGGAPDTLTFQSWSGMLHLIFRDPEGVIRNSASKIGPGIDTRGEGGYGVGPGSTIGGKRYSVLNAAPTADLPQWVADLYGRAPEHAAREAGEYNEEWAVEYATWEIDHGRGQWANMPAQGDRNNLTFNRAVRLHGLGVPEAVAVGMLHEWAARGEPPDETIESLIEGAYHDRKQNDFGSELPPGWNDGAATFAEHIAKWLERITAEAAAKRRAKYKFRTPEQDANLPPLAYWDEHRSLPKIPGGCALIAYGKMSSHKTGVVLKYCLDAVQNGARVLYLAPEGAHGIRTQRLRAACAQRGMSLADLAGRWHTEDATPGLMKDGEIDELIEACREQGFSPNIVIIDTLTRAAHGFDISAPLTGEGLIVGMERIGAAFDATVIAITHPGKEAGRGSIGSSLIESLAFAIWKITIKDDDAIKLEVEKMKDGPAGFALRFAIERDDRNVPVIAEGMSAEPEHTPANAAPISVQVMEALQAQPRGKTITTIQLAHTIRPMEPGEELEEYTRRIAALVKQLQRKAELTDAGKPRELRDFVKRARRGDMLVPLRWCLPEGDEGLVPKLADVRGLLINRGITEPAKGLTTTQLVHELLPQRSNPEERAKMCEYVVQRLEENPAVFAAVAARHDGNLLWYKVR